MTTDYTITDNTVTFEAGSIPDVGAGIIVIYACESSNKMALVSTVGTGVRNTVFDEIIFDGADTDDIIPASAGPIDMAFPTSYSSEDPYLYLALADYPDTGTGEGNIYLCVIDDAGGDSEAKAY